jgi:hypothetical protein
LRDRKKKVSTKPRPRRDRTESHKALRHYGALPDADEDLLEELIPLQPSEILKLRKRAKGSLPPRIR